MFTYFTAYMDFKTLVQLQRSENVFKTFEAHGPSTWSELPVNSNKVGTKEYE